jgi:hypothetical protein
LGLGYILEIDPIHRQEAEGLKRRGKCVIDADDFNAYNMQTRVLVRPDDAGYSWFQDFNLAVASRSSEAHKPVWTAKTAAAAAAAAASAAAVAVAFAAAARDRRHPDTADCCLA